jgi:hypothetical protein
MSEKKESFFLKLLKWLLKFLWKLFLTLLWGCLRIMELICGAFAKWVKDINS